MICIPGNYGQNFAIFTGANNNILVWQLQCRSVFVSYHTRGNHSVWKSAASIWHATWIVDLRMTSETGPPYPTISALRIPVRNRIAACKCGSSVLLAAFCRRGWADPGQHAEDSVPRRRLGRTGSHRNNVKMLRAVVAAAGEAVHR